MITPDNEAEPLLREYLELSAEEEISRAEAARYAATAKACRDKLATLRVQLGNLVQPVCGSATRPPVLTYTNGKYQTACVFWDHDLQRGRVVITGNAGANWPR